MIKLRVNIDFKRILALKTLSSVLCRSSEFTFAIKSAHSCLHLPCVAHVDESIRLWLHTHLRWCRRCRPIAEPQTPRTRRVIIRSYPNKTRVIRTVRLPVSLGNLAPRGFDAVLSSQATGAFSHHLTEIPCVAPFPFHPFSSFPFSTPYEESLWLEVL